MLIKAIKESNLVVGTFGTENESEAQVQLQESNGVDGILVKDIYRVINKSTI